MFESCDALTLLPRKFFCGMQMTLLSLFESGPLHIKLVCLRRGNPVTGGDLGGCSEGFFFCFLKQMKRYFIALCTRRVQPT